ncbi:MAG: hypothetical protein LW698_10305 [Planctomycetaceae bacterium]|jgi:SOS-response transcriptional repressor LexA|nr:hypothetical protein [Planctomycetaceae bacterium]
MIATTTPAITPRQRELLHTIKRLSADAKGVPPTLRQIAGEMRIHWTAARKLAQRCEAAGHLRHTPRAARSWVVLDEHQEGRR